MTAKPNTNPIDDCSALIELMPEYAFGLTDDDQARLIEAKLAHCPEAAQRLDDFRRLQEEMRASVPQYELPSELGSRLMAAVAAAPAPVAAPVPAVLPKPRRRGRWAWAIAAAAVFTLVITNVYWLLRVDDLTQTQNLLSALLSAQPNAFVVTNTTGLHWVRLASTQDQGTASAFMMWNSQSKTGLLYARNFPALEPGKIYHLWLTRGDQLVFAGVFRVDDQGDGALLFSSPEPIDDFTWARVTAETQGSTSATPTGTPLVTGELS